MSIKLIDAIKFATKHHEGQMRKGENLPYIVHPLRVLAIISSYNNNEAVLCAAVLHDVIEDTEATAHDVREKFGIYICKLVLELTDISKPEDGNRAKRKEIDRQHIASGSNECHLIKIADLIDNTESIIKHMPDFAPVYIQEKERLLSELGGAPSGLHRIARELIQEYKINNPWIYRV